MKKIYVMFLMAAIYPFVGRSQDIDNLQLSELALVGISDAYSGVKRYCAKTTSEELLPLNSYIIQNNGNLTAQGLVDKCQYYLKQAQDSCSEDKLVIDKDIPARVQCQAYIGTALDTHNRLVDKLKYPGTYIQLYHGTGQLGNHRGVYSIVGVVPGNSNDVYEITASGQVNKLAFKTEDPRMFMNIDTNNNIIGVHNHSVIYTQLDMTKAVSDMIHQKTIPDGFEYQYLLVPGVGSLVSAGVDGYTINSIGLASKGDLDIKDAIGARLYITPEQQTDKKYGATYAHSNGVMFEGKIVNFEWLGHYIFGARKGLDGGLTGGLYDYMADREQAKTSGQTKGQGQTDSDFHKNVAEQARRRYSGEQAFKPDAAGFEFDKHIIGSEEKSGSSILNKDPRNPFNTHAMVSESTSTRGYQKQAEIRSFERAVANDRGAFMAMPTCYEFKNRQTRTEPEAYRLAGEYTKKILRNASYVKCWGVCGSSGDDIVTCSWRTETGEGDTTDFIFDDICDGTPNYTTLHEEKKFSSVQTRTEHEATMKTEDYIRAEYPGSTDLICDADCDLMGDDTVYCFFKKGGKQYKQEFVFDDICN